jgi:hypothetical protein
MRSHSVLVPMFGISMNGVWAARHGSYGPQWAERFTDRSRIARTEQYETACRPLRLRPHLIGCGRSPRRRHYPGGPGREGCRRAGCDDGRQRVSSGRRLSGAAPITLKYDYSGTPEVPLEHTSGDIAHHRRCLSLSPTTMVAPGALT